MAMFFRSRLIFTTVPRKRISTSDYPTIRTSVTAPQVLPRYFQSSNKWNSVRFLHSSPAVASPKTFTYGIAASYTAKHQAYDSQKNLFVFKPSHTVRSPFTKTRLRHRSGQDDFYVSRVGRGSNIAMGVADGVGGWDSAGLDSAEISDGLCTYMAYNAFTYNAQEWGQKFEAQSLMQRSYKDLLNDKNVAGGSTTALVAVAQADGKLDVANLGDSGFIQIRLNAIHTQSKPQTHCFNTPYQLTVLPGVRRVQTPDTAGCILDYPTDADVSQHDLQHGDVVVFATDGLWDNLFAAEVLKIVSQTMLESQAWVSSKTGIIVSSNLSDFITSTDDSPTNASLPSMLARKITSEAKIQSHNMRRCSPFTLELAKMYPEAEAIGGKVDDICVLVMVVCQTEN